MFFASVDDIFYLQGDYGSVIDYWPFVKGMKWLNPVMTPFIEKIRKGHYPKGVSKGQVWVRESLREHKLSMQLIVLVSNEQHMHRHYFGKEGFQTCFRCKNS